MVKVWEFLVSLLMVFLWVNSMLIVLGIVRVEEE